MGELAASPERNVVTIVVIDTVGSTEHIALLDPDDAQALLDRVFDHIRETIERAGGLLVSFAGDGGVAVFGWPGSQEDHADRACEAAWEVQHPGTGRETLLGPDGSPIKYRIGIHSGLVGLRRLALESGRILDLVGGTIHLAAALEKRAPHGEILLSSHTLELCRAEMNLVDREGFPALEKIGASVHLLTARPHRLTASDMVQRHRLPMIGRDDQRARLKECLPRRGGRNHVVATIGEPGIGKSRIVTATIRDADSQPISIDVLVFHCDMRKRAIPFAAMRALIAQALEMDERADACALQAVLANQSPPIEESDTERVAEFWEGRSSPVEGAAALSQVLVNVFLRVAIRQPLLAVIEDIHWLDPESLRCFEILREAETSYPFTLLLTGRPEATDNAERVAEDVIYLEPLTDIQMQELAAQASTSSPLKKELINEAVERSDGVPFVLEQMLASISDGKSQTLPRSVESVVHARLNQLSNASKTLAQALSVFGENIELQFASKTLDIAPEDLQKSLSELELKDIIHPPLGRKIQFRHAMVLEACATTVGRETREILHKNAIRTIHDLNSNLDDQYERLAFHAEAAGDDRLALDYFWKAGLIASRTWASGSLLLIFESAVACMKRIGPETDERFVDFVLMTYTPLLQLGEFTKMNPHLERALAIAEAGDRPNRYCGMLCQKSTICWFEGRYEDGLEAAGKAIEMAEELDSISLQLSAQLMLGNMYWGLARIDEAIETQKDLVSKLGGKFLTSKLGAAAIPAALARANISWYMMEVGSYEEGLPFATEALELAIEQKDVYSEVLARIGYGRNLMMLQRIDEAEECLREGRNLALRNGYDPAAMHLVGLLAATLSRNGKAEEAVTIVEQQLNSRSRSRAGELENYYLLAGQSEALFQLSRQDECLDTINRALDHAMSINNQCLITQGLGLRAHFRLLRDPTDKDGLRDRKMRDSLCEEYGLKPWI